MNNKYSLGLLGYPVSHSLSPRLHQAALAAAGLEGVYRLYPIAPGEGGGELRELKELLGKVRGGEIQGLNVTIPHKQTVIPYLDELTPTAQAIGAVNTIYRSADFNRLIGDNTDAPGFLADLCASFPHLCHHSLVEGFGLKVETPILQPSTFNQRHALVLGAGGSARAVVYALLQDGWNITLYARRPEQAETLATQFSPFTNASQSFTIQNSLFTIDHSLIVNTTPLGMTPNLATSPWPADLPFPEHAAVYDLVYNPRETKLVRDAHAAGHPATTGLGMLIEQAALGFELWTGREADREGMRNAVR